MGYCNLRKGDCPTPLLHISSALCFMRSVSAAGLNAGGTQFDKALGAWSCILHRIYDFYATSEALEEGLNAHSKAQPQT